MYLQIYDDPEAESFTKDTILIFVNSLHILGFETLQNKFYRENPAMTQFRMIPESYLTKDLSLKL